jgi:hypothetical protein
MVERGLAPSTTDMGDTYPFQITSASVVVPLERGQKGEYRSKGFRRET